MCAVVPRKESSISSASQPIILLVDDNPGDLELTQIAFEQAGVKAHFQTAINGAVALNILRKLVEDLSLPRPNLVLLDLNMPKVSGFEVLSYLKKEPSLKAIPTIILTTSNSPHDRNRTTAMGADDYLVKPSQFDEFVTMVQQVRVLLED
jgi:CheY-like chemotaxis protein